MADPELALSIAFRAAAAALAVGSMEQLAVYDRAYGPLGPFSESVSTVLNRPASQVIVGGHRLLFVLTAGTIFAIVASVSGPFAPIGVTAGLAALACVLASKWRRVTASDGAEQMAILTIFATCLVTLPGNNLDVVEVGVWFVAGQSILSYATSGIAKSLSPTWRGGHALSMIMGSEAHGCRWASSLLEAHQSLAKLLTRCVVVFECAFPLILLAPRELVLTMLVVGFLFHLGCAITMGLNSFLVVFPATYACVAYIAHKISPFW